MVRALFVLGFVICLFSCRKDPQFTDLSNDESGSNCYENGSHLAYDNPELREIVSGIPTTGPYYTPAGPYYIYTAKFNPDNANQIIYVKQDTGFAVKEIWFYDFCSKNSRLISTEYRAGLTWGPDDKILFNGSGWKAYMMNTSGEDLQLIGANPAFQIVGNFSPNGAYFYSFGADGFRVFDKNGMLLKENSGYQPYTPIDWIDNSHLIVLNEETQLLQSLKWENDTRHNLSNAPQCSDCGKIYNRKTNTLYFIVHEFGENKGLYSFNIDSGQTKFLKALHTSYMFESGDISLHSNKLLINVREMWWKDSLSDLRYIKHNLMLLNDNATNPRIVDLP